MRMVDASRPPADVGIEVARVATLTARVKAWIGDKSASGVAQRFASLAFLFRLANAGIAFLTQILLARWMGQHEFGIYVYVWTWVVLLGTLTNVGLASSPQRFIPTYIERGELDRLRGFVHGGRWLAFGIATGFAVLASIALVLLRDSISPWLLVPAFLGLGCLPLFVVQEVQEGIARAYDWPHIAMAPSYMVRPILIMALMAAMHVAGYPASAVGAMLAALIATWIAAFAQFVVLNRRLKRRIEDGPRHYAPREWLRISTPQFLVEGFYLLLTYCDVIVLERFVTPGQVAIYYAATKLVSLVAFVYFSVAAASAHKFTQYHVGNRPEELHEFLRASIRWTFLPSLAMATVLLAIGRPLLSLFGPGFEDGFPIMAVLLLGLLARASIGPVEKLLTMLGHQSLCAWVYAGAFVGNIALNFALVPYFGLMGAACATSIALVLESILLFALTKQRLGLHVFYWGHPRTPAG